MPQGAPVHFCCTGVMFILASKKTAPISSFLCLHRRDGIIVILKRLVKIHYGDLDLTQRCFRELWKFHRISSSHVCVAFRGLLQNTFFESSKNIRFQKKFKQNELLIEELGHFEHRSMLTLKKTTKSSKSIKIRIFYYRKSYSKLFGFTYILKI